MVSTLVFVSFCMPFFVFNCPVELIIVFSYREEHHGFWKEKRISNGTVKLVDLGYDVWMGNDRGTRYSNVNSNFPDAEDYDSPTTCLGLFACSALAYPTAEEREAVSSWDEEAVYYGFDYEIHTAVTEDDWELTLFRITGRDGEDKVASTKPPILL